MPETKNSGSQAEDLNKELQQLKKQLKERDQAIEQLEMKTKQIPKDQTSKDTSNEMLQVVKELQREIDLLKSKDSSQPRYTPDGRKIKYRDPKPEDILDDGEAVTFIARCVTYVVPSYMDDNGIEVIAPHKMIVFRYASSDIRQDGKEESVINFCQYTTKLKTERDFLRAHPQYGLMFSESMNEVASFDHKEFEFKARVASEVASMSPESIFEHARIRKIPNREKLSVSALRHILAAEFTKEYLKENEELRKKRILEMELKGAK